MFTFTNCPKQTKGNAHLPEQIAAKTLNFADNDGGPRIAYLAEKQRNRGPAAYDRTHNLQSYAVYDLPFGKGQRWANDGWEERSSVVFR